MLDLSKLSQFTGTEHWYRHPLVRGVTYTDGVKYVADEAGAHWLLDIIATQQHERKIKIEPFQVWRLAIKEGKGSITVDNGEGKALYHQTLDYTTFPEPGITLWVCDRVILLPGEY
jgi:hypothetical protein